jgi:excisionase family DNA binding protein
MKRHRQLDEKQTAELVTKSKGTLRNWRSNGRYPLPFIRVGRSIRYREEDVLAFLEAGRVDPDKAAQ